MQRVKNLRETVACASRNTGFSLNSLILLDPREVVDDLLRSGACMYIRVYAQYTRETAAGPVTLYTIHVHICAYSV